MYKIQGGTNIKPLVTKILLRGIRLSIGNKNLINENHLIITNQMDLTPIKTNQCWQEKMGYTE